MRRLSRAALAVLVIAALPLAAHAGGTAAGPNVQVTDAALGSDDAAQPEVAVRGASVYAAWLDEREGDSTERPIYFARSDDAGASWGANRRVSLPSYVGFTDRPAISVAPDGSIWIAWWLSSCFSISGACGGVDRQNDTRLALSTDGGQTFGEYQVLNGSDSGDSIDFAPEIHAESDRTLVLTVNPSGLGADVLLRVASRSGPGTLQVTSVPVSAAGGNGRVTDGAVPDGPKASLAVRGSAVCAAWEDRRSSAAIYAACSGDGGQTFGANVPVSGGGGVEPRIAFGPDGTLYAAYKSAAGGPIFIRRSADGGATWDAPNQAFVYNASLDTGDFDLDVDPAGQLLLTVPLLDGTPSSGISDLYMATSIDGGRQFALTGPLEDAQGQYPGVATQNHARTAVGSGPAGARAYTIWSDDRNSARQIWSARLDLDSAPPSAPASLQAQPGDTSALLTWGAASDPSGIAGYIVQRAPAPAGPFVQLNPRLVGGLSYRDVGLAAGSYAYRVLAVDGTGNPGPPSNTVVVAAAAGSGLAGLRGTVLYQTGADGVALRSIAGGALGGERVVGQGFAPVFSADGGRLLRTSGSSVVSQRLDGSDARTVYVNDTPVGSLDTAADPNVLGAVHQMFFGGPAICIAYEPRIMGLAPKQELFRVSATIATDMAISSDRAWIGYVYKVWCNTLGGGSYDTPRLCLQNVASGSERCLDGVDVESLDFVPGRAQIVFSARFAAQREVWRADVQPDGSLRDLAQLTRGPAGQPSTAPRVSTDGSWVVFTRDVDPGPAEQPVLHVVRLDGDGLRSLGVVGRAPDWAGGGPPAPFVEGGRVSLPLVRR